MCGRYSLVTTEKEVQKQLPFLETTGINLKESYNITPTQHAYVVTNALPERLQYITWGLIPFWSNDGKNAGRLINARAEGIQSKPSFRMPIRKKRCLVIADSFYEWRKVGKEKLPYRILPKDNKLIMMAGVWDEWQDKDYTKRSFSIITTTPNEEVTPIHNRMPVIFSNIADCEKWLSDLPLVEVLQMLCPVQNDYIEVYPVAKLVNSVLSNSPHLHEKVSGRLDLFSK